MKNRGYMTIFVSLLLAALVVIYLVIFRIVDIASARSKSGIALSTACSSVKADRTSAYIFDRYHILLIDMNRGDDGEDGISRDIRESLEENLGSEYSINSVSVCGRTGILDDDCEAFKEQIRDYFLYGVTEFVVDDLVKKTDGNDEPVSQESIDAMDAEVDGVSEENVESLPAENSSASETKPDVKPDAGKTKKDPRKEVRKVKKRGVAFYILPEDSEFSENVVNSGEMPSYGHGGWFDMEIDTDFDNYSKLKKQMNKSSGWSESLVTGGESIAYANRMFNSFTDEKYDDTYLKLEMEYIIAGKPTDAENYKKVINQIIVIRFGCNFAYLLTDASKMAELDTLALSLTFFIPVLQPLVKYLLTGCWAYVEAVADAYCLVRGHKIPYLKNAANWKTSIDGITKLAEIDMTSGDSDEEGLDYNDYLMILMGLNMKTAYYRMLDVIQLNASQESPDFRMKNAAVAFGVDAEIGYREKTFDLHAEDGY
ncbi:MAG: hypothetical protein J6O17_07115 [Eubacterium sp.]|nr:hypothetical protein [Eubacterium sp.]